MLLDNDKETIKNIINKFIISTEENIQTMQSAIQARDARGIEHMAHTIKGTSSQMGAQVLANIAFDLEMKGKKADLKKSAEKFTELSNTFNKVKAIITKNEL